MRRRGPIVLGEVFMRVNVVVPVGVTVSTPSHSTVLLENGADRIVTVIVAGKVVAADVDVGEGAPGMLVYDDGLAGQDGDRQEEEQQRDQAAPIGTPPQSRGTPSSPRHALRVPHDDRRVTSWPSSGRGGVVKTRDFG